MQPTWDVNIDWVLWLARRRLNFDHFQKPIDLSESVVFFFLLDEKKI